LERRLAVREDLAVTGSRGFGGLAPQGDELVLGGLADGDSLELYRFVGDAIRAGRCGPTARAICCFSRDIAG